MRQLGLILAYIGLLFGPLKVTLGVDSNSLNGGTYVDSPLRYFCTKVIDGRLHGRQVHIERGPVLSRDDYARPVPRKGAIGRANMRFRKYVGVSVDGQTKHRQLQGVSLIAEDRDADDRSDLNRLLPELRICAHRISVHRQQGIFRCFDMTLQRTALLENLLDHHESFYPVRCSRAVNGVVPPTRAPKLASVWQDVTVLINHSAIGGNCDFSFASNGCNSGPMQKRLCLTPNRKDQHHQPHWVRHRYSEMSFCGNDSIGSLICDVGTEDIDVSADGRKWFHAVGTRCSEGLPIWK